MSVSEIVCFLHAYRTMTPVEKTSPETIESVKRVKGLIEESLPTNIMMALGHGIQLGEACQDPAWISALCEKAKPIAEGLDPDDRDDIQGIFEKYAKTN